LFDTDGILPFFANKLSSIAAINVQAFVAKRVLDERRPSYANVKEISAQTKSTRRSKTSAKSLQLQLSHDGKILLKFLDPNRYPNSRHNLIIFRQ